MSDKSDPKRPSPPIAESILTTPLADALAKGLQAGAAVVASNLFKHAVPAPRIKDKPLPKLQRTVLWCVAVALTLGVFSGMAVEDRQPAVAPTRAAQVAAHPATSTCTTVSTVEKKAADGTVITTRTETKETCDSEKLSAGASLGIRAAYYAVLAIF